LVQAMVTAGHEATVLSQPGVHDRAVAAGASFAVFADFGDYATDVAIEEQLDLVLTSLAGIGTGEQLTALASSIGADAVVVDCNLAAALAAAEALPVPSAALFHSMYATFTDVWFAELWPLLAESVNAARSAFGVPAAAGWPEVFAGQARLVAAVPASFDAPVRAVPATMRHHGFLVPASAGVEGPALAPARAGAPTVLVSRSTTPHGQADLLARIVAGVGSRNVRGLVTTGGQADPASLGAPEHVQCFDWLPHPAVLPETDVVVTHGGLGTCAGALGAGVPLVCLPLGRDQHLNAARVEAVGAGVSLPSDARPDAIAAAIDLVLGDPAYRAAAGRIADESRAAGGAPAVVADLESLL
jgi:UDP:flavonoid glycosyltransferase YjiC (YdhE family)